MSSKLENLGIGAKLKEFGLQNFKKITDFANALEMKGPSLYSYLEGKRYPGAPVLYKLRQLGCDLNWLFDKEEEADKGNLPPHIVKELELLRKENKELKQKVSKMKSVLK